MTSFSPVPFLMYSSWRRIDTLLTVVTAWNTSTQNIIYTKMFNSNVPSLDESLFVFSE